MSVIVIGHIVLIDHLDSPQIFSVINSFKTGHDQPDRKALLRTHCLAILAVAYQTIVHGLAEGNARRAFYGLRPFRHDEGARRSARRPPSATGTEARQSTRSNSSFRATPAQFYGRSRAISEALEKMRAGYKRQALYFVHRKNQRPVHHPVDHQPVFRGIDVGR